jgi:hypothetical protein
MMTPNNIPPGIKNIIDLDKNLRKNVTEYYFALCKLNDPAKAIELLAGHVAIMVEMINELKKGK